MVFKYCLGMIMSVSTLIAFSGAATPSSVVNLSIEKILLAGAHTGPPGHCHDGLLPTGQDRRRGRAMRALWVCETSVSGHPCFSFLWIAASPVTQGRAERNQFCRFGAS